MPSFFVFKILKIKITSSWIFFVEKTENADFTDFQTRILSYNQRESALPKYPFNQRSTKLFQEPNFINSIKMNFRFFKKLLLKFS